MKVLCLCILVIGSVISLGASEGNYRRKLYTDATRSFNNSYSVRKDDPNGERLDNFGRSIAIQPGLAIVGSPEDDDNVIAEDAGALFVFIEDNANSEWRLIRQIEDGEPGDYFGWSVALSSDNFAVVGACRGSLYGKYSGAAYTMFIEPDPYGDQAVPVHITPSERHGSAFFGFSVAVDTPVNGILRIVVGAYGHRGKGAAFVYTRNSAGALSNEEILYGSDSVQNDKFGWGVSIHNGLVGVGAPMDNKQGSAYVFRKTSGKYAQLQKLSQSFVDDDANNPLYGDFFGMCVVVGNRFVAISSPHNDVRADDAGAVYIYTLSGTSYAFSQTLFAPTTRAYMRFGWSMAYDRTYDRLLIGAEYSKLTSISGEAYLYSMSASTFFALEDIIYPTAIDNDDNFVESNDANFGFSVAVSGDYMAIGAEMGTGEALLSGDAYFYRAQTKAEMALRKAGQHVQQSSSSGDSSTSTSAFSAVGLTLLVLVPLTACAVLFMWYRYKADGDDEGFGLYVADELADAWDRVRGSGSEKETTLQFMEDDDSQHSSHPMMDSRPSSSGDRDVSAKKPSRSKLSGLKSSSRSSSRGSSRLSSASSKRAAGYTSANSEDV